jgi:hypothetical protein
MELLYRFTASLTETEVVGVVPEGLRLDVHFEGQVIAGALVGARVRGLDYLLLRADGVGVIDEYETIDAGDGRVVSAHAQGYIVRRSARSLLGRRYCSRPTSPGLTGFPCRYAGSCSIGPALLTWRT